MVVKDLKFIRSVISLFKDFAEWSHQHKASAFTGILTLASVGFLVIGLIYSYNKFAKPIKILTENYNATQATQLTPQNTQAAFEKFISRSRVIDHLLRDEMIEQDADRAYLFMFHDSLTGLDNKHFFYMSNTNEQTKTGVSKEMNSLQRLPVALLNGWAVEFLKKKCIIETVKNMNEDDAKKSLLEKQGVAIAMECPIFSKGILLGYVGFDFMKERKIDKTFHLQALAGNIQAVLEVE